MRRKLSEKDYEWLMKVKDNPNKYYIEIDNGEICIVDAEAWANDDVVGSAPHDFKEHGDYFIEQLLNSLGIRTELC